MTSAVRRASIIAIGDELLSGQVLDRNSSWLAGALSDLGFELCGFTVLGDDEEQVVARLEEAACGVDLLVLTGGLGPTLDDLTRHAVARAVGAELELDELVVEEIRRRFEEAGRQMSPSNSRQGLFPAGAVVLPNRVGTAPGFRVLHPAGAWIVCLPGPPRELHPLFTGEVVPWLEQALPRTTCLDVAQFALFGLPESEFAERVGTWMERDAEPRMGVCASGRVLKVRVEGRREAQAGGNPVFEERVRAFRERFATWIFSESHASPARALAELCMDLGLTIACAESCTGGDIASRLVAQAGISEVFLEGLVTYSNESKVARLGVAAELLNEHGAVSREVAEAMVRGLARTSGARLCLSTTGVAGPAGGTPEKPVGLVHVGISLDGEVSSHELRLPPRGRELVRDWATTSACALALRAVRAGLADG
jgi:nicotinamide-nucleotide amidase